MHINVSLEHIAWIYLYVGKKLKACFDLLSQTFPCFLSPFHMFVDTMIVNFN